MKMKADGCFSSPWREGIFAQFISFRGAACNAFRQRCADFSAQRDGLLPSTAPERPCRRSLQGNSLAKMRFRRTCQSHRATHTLASFFDKKTAKKNLIPDSKYLILK